MAVLSTLNDALVFAICSRTGLASLATIAFLVYLLYLRPYHLSTIKNIPGPSGDSILSGNLTSIFKGEAAELHEKWTAKYGPTIMYRGFLGGNRLYVTDPKALSHILVSKPYEYPKPIQTRHLLAQMLGEGILFVEGDQHKRHRRILSAPFTQASTTSYYPIFHEIAEKLVSKLNTVIDSQLVEEKKDPSSTTDYTVINIYSYLSRATLDIIGKAGFDYDFKALDDEENELANVYQQMLQPREIKISVILITALVRWIPMLKNIPTKSTKRIKKATEVMQREGKKMLAERREQAIAGELEGKKDLLSLIVKANSETKNPKDKLHDDEIMGQISTFSLAGHETSSVALTWILYCLCLYPEVQAKLRKEILNAKKELETRGEAMFSTDDYAKMPYLDAVIREVLRYTPPVYITAREAAMDDVIPLSEAITGRDGQSISSLVVKKGQQVMIGIYCVNRSTKLFGEDAAVFRPERWLDGSLSNKNGGSEQLSYTAWGDMMTFLAGPRGCIGYRFSLAEIRTLTTALIANFEFLERDEGGTPITKRSNVVTRPVVLGEEDKGGQLPLRMRRVQKTSA